VTGEFSNSATFGTITVNGSLKNKFTARISPNGDVDWVVPTSTPLDRSGDSISVLVDGSPIVKGWTGSGISVMKLSPDGTLNIDLLAPVFSSPVIATSINENSGANKTIYTAQATDDTSSVAYSLKDGPDRNVFSIDQISGVVTLIPDPDFETQSFYQFTIVATDQARNSAEQTVTLAINDLDENPSPPPGGSTNTNNGNSGSQPGSGGSGGTGGNVTLTEESSNPQPEPTAPSAGRRIFASNPADPVIGTDGDDQLVPKSPGLYFMTGNRGADKFVFAVAESRTIDNADYITDYSLKEGDRVVLYDQVFGLGSLKFKVAKNKKKVKKLYNKKTNLIYDQSKSQLIVDLNGRGKGLAGGGVIAVFTNEAKLTKTSFELIEGVPPSEMLG
jgi:hypothetical protein